MCIYPPTRCLKLVFWCVDRLACIITTNTIINIFLKLEFGSLKGVENFIIRRMYGPEWVVLDGIFNPIGQD